MPINTKDKISISFSLPLNMLDEYIQIANERKWSRAKLALVIVTENLDSYKHQPKK